MFVLNVGYRNMTTNPLRKYYYIIESVYFIYRLFILFISTLSSLLFLYTVSWRYKRDYLHTNIDILLYIMFCTINTMKDINPFVPRSYLRYKKGPDLNLLSPLPPIPLFVATPLVNCYNQKQIKSLARWSFDLYCLQGYTSFRTLWI